MGAYKQVVVGLAAGMILAPVWARAATRDWANERGASFAQASAWSPATVPGKRDLARFNASGAYTVRLDGNRANSGLLIGNDKVLLDLGRHRYDVFGTNRRTAVYLGLAGSDVARLTIRNGALRSGPATLGGAPGSFGNITLLGDAAWENDGLMAVGGRGRGGLNVVGGAKLSSGSAGVGMYAGSKGNVLLSDTGSSWDIDRSLYVGGKWAAGQVVVRNGADLSVGELLNVWRRSVVQLDGGRLAVGSIARAGSVTFTAGTLELTRSDLTIGSGVFGDTLRLNSRQDLRVHQRTTVSDHGLLELVGGTFVSGGIINDGQIRLAGGMLGGALDNRADGRLLVSAGSAVFADAIHHDGLISVDPRASVLFAGPIAGVGSFGGGGRITFGGEYAVGPRGGVRFDNLVEFAPGARLAMELGEPGEDAGALIDVAGRIHLRRVNVNLDEGFVPQGGESFELIRGPIVYESDFELLLPQLPADRAFEVTRTEQSLRLNVAIVPEPAGGGMLLGLGALALRRRARSKR